MDFGSNFSSMPFFFLPTAAAHCCLPHQVSTQGWVPQDVKKAPQNQFTGREQTYIMKYSDIRFNSNTT
jgi:hypothetical protein